MKITDSTHLFHREIFIKEVAGFIVGGPRMKLPLLLILILAVPFSFGAEMCVFDGAADYTCYDRLAVGNECSDYPNDFPGCCLNVFKGEVKTGTAIPECNQVCCCDGSLAVQDDPMSQALCQLERDGNSNIQILGQGASCDAVCAQSGGSGTQRVTVSGTVSADNALVSGATVTYSSGLLALSDSQGAYSISSVPAAPAASFTATYAGCQEQTQTIDLSAGQDQTLSFNLDCSGGSGCTPAAVSDTRVTIDQTTGAARIVWTPDTCAEIIGYSIYRCDASSGGCSGTEEPIGGIPFGQAGTFIDSNVPTDSAVCYLVKPRTIVDGEVEPIQTDGENCIGAISDICLSQPRLGPRCFNGDTSINPLGATTDPFYGGAFCDQSQSLQVLTNPQGNLVECDYEGGELCMMIAGTPTCTTENICDQCNGPYGWFVDPTARSSSTTCANMQSCVLDNAAYSQNTYVSCAKITSCYDYNSESACEGAGIDRCQVTDGPCTWSPVEGLEEIGRGICVPQNPHPSSAPCEKCEELHGSCDETLCAAMGECYYNEQAELGGFGEEIACLPKDKMACAFYDDQASCGGQVQVNVQYSSGSRTGGTNAIITKSNDVFGFGVCDWTGGSCVKDADGDSSGVDDCLQDGTSGVPFSCFTDVEPPITTIPLWDGVEITLDQLLTITPGVDDGDGYDASQIMTHACLVPASSTPCYPNDTFSNLNIEWPDDSAFTLYYYSWDLAGNLEPINSVNLFLPGEGGSSNLRLVSASVVMS